MPEIEYEIKGLKEMAKNLDSLGKNFARSTLRTALRNAAKPVVKRAKAKVPVATGDLKRSLAAVAKVDRDGVGIARVGARRDGGFRGYHVGLVELGTSQQPARPFLRPALDDAESQGEVRDAFITALNATIEKRAAKNRSR